MKIPPQYSVLCSNISIILLEIDRLHSAHYSDRARLTPPATATGVLGSISTDPDSDTLKCNILRFFSIFLYLLFPSTMFDHAMHTRGKQFYLLDIESSKQPWWNKHVMQKISGKGLRLQE